MPPHSFIGATTLLILHCFIDYYQYNYSTTIHSSLLVQQPIHFGQWGIRGGQVGSRETLLGLFSRRLHAAAERTVGGGETTLNPGLPKAKDGEKLRTETC